MTKKPLTQKQSNKLHKSFIITAVDRADIAGMQNWNEQKALKITDDQMDTIASKMVDAYCDMGFWESLEVCLEDLC